MVAMRRRKAHVWQSKTLVLPCLLATIPYVLRYLIAHKT
jgi:hypothetical protein